MFNPQLWIYTIPAGVTFLFVLVAFWWKEPQIPPAPSSDREHIPPFFKGLFQVDLLRATAGPHALYGVLQTGVEELVILGVADLLGRGIRDIQRPPHSPPANTLSLWIY